MLAVEMPIFIVGTMSRQSGIMTGPFLKGGVKVRQVAE
jgi:hypothetical protein